MKTLIVSNPLLVLHEPGLGHVESPGRLHHILKALDPLPYNAQFQVSTQPATNTDLLRVHRDAYIDSVLAMKGKYAMLDHETLLSPYSVDAALLAAGSGIATVEAILLGQAANGIALVRPPGHHASQGQGMGFCIFNNISVAAHYLLNHGINRILIIDWDVHHGNGTQEIFYQSSDVLFCDIHQDGLYPNTGSLKEWGNGTGLGYTVNIPLPPASTIVDYAYVLERIIEPIAAWYQPEFLLVSCGFDGHEDDSEGGMLLRADDFAYLTGFARQLAERWAAGRLALFLEGGYALPSIGSCARACVEALAGQTKLTAPNQPAIRDRHAVQLASRYLKQLHPGIHLPMDMNDG